MKAIKESFEKNRKSYGFAFKGILLGSKGNNFRYQFLAGVIAVALGLYLDISPAEWLAIILVIGLVLGAEIFNSAIELLVDLVSPDHHPIAGQVKDLAAGAVLLLAITALVAGLYIFIPKIILLIN